MQRPAPTSITRTTDSSTWAGGDGQCANLTVPDTPSPGAVPPMLVPTPAPAAPAIADAAVPIPTGVQLSVNFEAEEAHVTNGSSSPLNLAGWTMVSVAGSQRFTFPDITLGVGETVTVTSGSNSTHLLPRLLRWTNANIWNNSGDTARLFNPQGEFVESAGGSNGPW